MYQKLIDSLHADIPGYHFEISIFPSGGSIDADPCEICGSVKAATANWRYKKGPLHTFDEAISSLQAKLSV